jgi:hypothetical protein
VLLTGCVVTPTAPTWRRTSTTRCARIGNGYTLDDDAAESLARQLVEDWTVLYDGEQSNVVRSLPQKLHTDTGDEVGS